MKSTIRLFKAVPITVKLKIVDKELMKKTISRGYIFTPEVVYNYPSRDFPSCEVLMRWVEEIYGITAEGLNSSFHKSWIKIKDTPMEQLVVEQLVHYLTTYGQEQPGEYLIEKEAQWGVDYLAEKIIELRDFESDKIRDENYVYIPKEKLEIPDIDIEDIKLVVIKGYTKEELKAKLMDILQSGIALGEDTRNDVVDVAKFLELDEGDVGAVKNKEVKSVLYDYLNLVPENPVEFLRYVVYKATGKTLLIKNKVLIEAIKESESKKVVTKLFNGYQKEYGLERLAEIFMRFKPIFLAMRKMKDNID